MNKFSITLGFIMLNLLLEGGLMIYQGNAWGIIPFLVGGMMLKGLKGPKSTTESPTKKVWLLTLFGRHTKTVVRGLTLVLDWPLDIVGFIEIDMKVHDEDFKLKKKIQCTGDGAYVQGETSVAFSADDEDDPDPTSPTFKSAGEKLQDYLNIGGHPGAKMQLDDILTTQVEHEGKNNRTSLWMETSGQELSEIIMPKVIGHLQRVAAQNSGDDLDDTRGFGLKFFKFQTILWTSDKIQDARDDVVIEDAQKKSDEKDSRTMNQLIQERLNLHRSNGNVRITTDQVQEQLFNEKALKAGKLTVVLNPKGVNITTTPTP